MLDGHLLLLARQMRAAEEELETQTLCWDSSLCSTEKVYRCNIALEMSKEECRRRREIT